MKEHYINTLNTISTPCHTNYFPENVPVLTIQFYSKSVHVIKEKTKIFFLFFCVVDGKKSFTLKGLTCERFGDVMVDFSLKNARRLSDVIVCQGVKHYIPKKTTFW